MKNFSADGSPTEEYPQRPCACYDGTVFVGHTVEDEDGEHEVEVIEPVPCRRCS